MIELNIIVFPNILHECCYLIFEALHVMPQLILLSKIVISHLIESVVVYFEKIFYTVLMMIHLLDHLLLLGDIRMFELDNILLYLLANISQHDIIMALMFVRTKLAIESFIDFATILNLGVLMVLAKEALRVVWEGPNFIKNFLFSLDFFWARSEFLESVHWIVVWIISRGEYTRLWTAMGWGGLALIHWLPWH